MTLRATKRPDLQKEIEKTDFSTPFLCTIDGSGMHTNFGASPDWLDIDKFTEKALEFAARKINFAGKPTRLSTDKPTTATRSSEDSAKGAHSSRTAAFKTGNEGNRIETTSPPSRLNQFQSRALVIAGLLAFAAVLFPPIEEHRIMSLSSRLITTRHAGFKFIAAVGETETPRFSETINVPLLTLELGAIFAGFGIALFLGRDK